MSFKVLVIDGQRIVHHGLREMLKGSEFEVAASVCNAEEAYRVIGTQVFDMVTLEIRLPGDGGLACLQRLKMDFPQTPILMLSSFDNPIFIAKSNALGAAGFRLKTAGREQLLETFRNVVDGQRVWTIEEIRKMTGSMSTPRLGLNFDVPLTNREVQVLVQMSEGATNKEIASGLEISYETVKEHVQHVLRKIGVADRTQAVVWAVRAGLI